MKKIAIIGAGPGGYVAGIRAAQLGAEVYLIEYDKLGGTCLNRGCIPTKAYFKNAEILKNLDNDIFALEIKDKKIDGKKLQDNKNKIVNDLVVGIDYLISQYKNIKYINAKAKIIDENTVEIKQDGKKENINVDNIIIATGSKPSYTETEGIDLPGVITSDDLLELDYIPESLTVVGGGVIGLEFASIYQEFGTSVDLIASRILKDSDKEIASKLPRLFKKRGMKVHKDFRASKIEALDGKLKITAKHKKKDKEVSIISDLVLMASGRSPVVDDLGLEDVSIKFDNKNGIAVDKDFRTNIDNIYAIGDVNNRGIQLAHVASKQGIYVAEKIMSIENKTNFDIYPDCIFTLPEVAFVGMKEKELKENNIEYKESKFLFAGNGKALTLGEKDGFVKVYADPKDNKLLGVTIMGPHANDLIHEAALAISNGMTVDMIQNTIHAHPTLSEAFMEAIDNLDNKSIHTIRR